MKHFGPDYRRAIGNSAPMKLTSHNNYGSALRCSSNSPGTKSNTNASILYDRILDAA